MWRVDATPQHFPKENISYCVSNISPAKQISPIPQEWISLQSLAFALRCYIGWGYHGTCTFFNPFHYPNGQYTNNNKGNKQILLFG